jgi:hypothetical protein
LIGVDDAVEGVAVDGAGGLDVLVVVEVIVRVDGREAACLLLDPRVARARALGGVPPL